MNSLEKYHIILKALAEQKPQELPTTGTKPKAAKGTCVLPTPGALPSGANVKAEPKGEAATLSAKVAKAEGEAATLSAKVANPEQSEVARAGLGLRGMGVFLGSL